VGLPDAVTPELMEDDQFLKQFHHALLEVCALHLAPLRNCAAAGNHGKGIA
jgi:hypothetical protein